MLYHVTRTLEIVLPLMDHPSEEFLASVEEDMMTLIMRHGQMIVQVTHRLQKGDDLYREDDPQLFPKESILVPELSAPPTSYFLDYNFFRLSYNPDPPLSSDVYVVPRSGY